MPLQIRNRGLFRAGKGIPAAAAAFSPLQLGFNHLYWAEGPEFVAQGIADGGTVQTWPDEIGTANATQATSARRPLYRTSGTGLSQPCIDFDGGDDCFPAVAFSPTFSVPHSVVIIAYNDATNIDDYIIDGMDSGHRRIVGLQATSNIFRHYAGASGTAGPPTGHVTVAKRGFVSKIVSGSSDILKIDGNVWSTVNAGDQAFNGISIGGAYDGLGAEFDGRIALVGTYDGDVETAPKWAQFAEWAWAKYGVAFTPQSVRDDYNRANGAWGVPWATTAPGGGASIDIVSNYGRFASTLSGGWAYYNTTRVHPSNHWSEVEIRQFAGHIVGPFVRYTDINNFYVGRMDDSGADTYQIYKRVGGAYTLLGSLAETFPAAPGVRLKLEVTGSGASTSLALKLWNGSSYDTKVSVTDSAGSLTNGYTGVYGQVISGGEVHIENFWAGNI
jgi:hypothetical protein